METYFAHTPNKDQEWHDLIEHLEGVAKLTQEFAEPFGAGNLGYWVGLCHDFGKFNTAFQSYLRAQSEGKPAERVPHAVFGAVLARAKTEGPEAALCVIGHHAGLPHAAEVSSRLITALNDPAFAVSFQNARSANMLLDPRFELGGPPKNPYRQELFVRMLFSALVDADFLDTEAHFNTERAFLRGFAPDLSTLWDRFQANQEKLHRNAPKTVVNRLRREIYEACVAAADGPQGIYRLTVPTGGGKTRSGLAFALRHAIRHRLRRIVVAIPYTSIIDQTAQEYRVILGDDAVLEHHSTVNWGEDTDETGERMRLAAENWDAPLIVTTTVQLFESLFANRPSRCRKLHRLAKSVLVLDEVQTLPVELLAPTLDVLRSLAEEYGVTVVLSTATQPALEGESPYLKAFPAGTVNEIVPEPERYFRFLKRVEYEFHIDPVPWERVASWITGHPQVMAVVNTRRDALTLLNLVGGEDVFHLSTLLCGAHRRDVLEQVRNRLKAGLPVRLISTQVVEAGVDLDFPYVYRAIGPLDRIVQAAGRCNREGRLASGRVIVFCPEGGRSPRGAYRTGLEEARVLLEEGVDLNDPEVYTRYFRRLYQGVDTDQRGIQALRKDMNYPEVAARYQLIADDTIPVVVRYRPEVDDLLREARTGVSRSLIRRLQPFLVNLFHWEFRDAQAAGLVDEIASGFFLWRGSYDPVKGLVALQVAHDPADLIV